MKAVIVGGGFGGIRSALSLARQSGFEVTLISKQGFFEYHAALYRSATGRSPLEVAIPLGEFFDYAQNVEVVEDEITGLDSSAKVLTGNSGSKYHYDVVIFALGNITQYFGIKGLSQNSYGVKTIQEALELKRHLHEDLLRNHGSERNYVVVGAGATGVELAAELVFYLRHVRKRHNKSVSYRVELVDYAPRPLPLMPIEYSNQVRQRLKKLGVHMFFNTAVKGETAQALMLPRGKITTHSVIWTAGVANNQFFKQYPSVFKLDSKGRVAVDEYLRAAPDIFVIGDSAATKYSGMAQTALHDADTVTQNLIRISKDKAMQPYIPLEPIYATPVGRRWAAVQWHSYTVYGFSGWVLRRLADLRLYLKFLPWQKALTTWRYGTTNQETCPYCK